MNFLPALSVWQFAVAGLVCAAGPILIHLLNRRRYKVISWAAMDFLKEALQRNRRMMQLRDLALLVLRTLAVLLVGVALAQPFFSPGASGLWKLALPAGLAFVLLSVVGAALWSQPLARWISLGGAAVALAVLLFAALPAMQGSSEGDGATPGDTSQRLHLVLLIDNSMSMGYLEEAAGQTLLDRAKTRAKEVVQRLPEGSMVSVVPVCGSQRGVTLDAYLTTEETEQAIDRITLVDRSANVATALNQARRACETVADLPQRIIFLGDQQQQNWTALSKGMFEKLPSVQIVSIAPEEPENSWIAGFHLQDGLADVETPATFVVQLRHQGLQSREDVAVTVTVEDPELGEIEVGSKSVTLEPGLGTREVDFQHVFSTARPESGRAVHIPVRATISSDRLAADDQREIVAPVVSTLPVVFVDQYGGNENLDRDMVGETRHLRRLLAPVIDRSGATRQLVEVRHVRPDEIDQELLSDARLVVLAGVENPGSAVELLREYVEQGGQLLIAAGGDFSTEAFNSTAWLNGRGILPAPLNSEPLGVLPEEAPSELKPFYLAYNSMESNAFFQLAGESEESLRDLYSDPFFFKAVRADVSPELLQQFTESQAQHLAEVEKQTKQQEELESLLRRDAAGELSEEEGKRLTELQSQITPSPKWLQWSGDRQLELAADADEKLDEAARQKRLERKAEQFQPRVLATFTDDDQTPFLVERKIGSGRVIFAASGIYSSWNTLPKTDAFLIFDRIARGMIQSTLPVRNLPPQDRVAMPLPVDDPNVSVRLLRPQEKEATELDTTFLGNRRGVAVENLLDRGIYRLSLVNPVAASSDPAVNAASARDAGLPPGEAAWELFAVNGDPTESELNSLTRDGFDQRIADAGLAEADIVWLGENEEISLSGGRVRGQHSWWYFIIAVLLFLLAEMVIIAWPVLKEQTAGETAAT